MKPTFRMMAICAGVLPALCFLAAFTEMRHQAPPCQTAEDYAAKTTPAPLAVKGDMVFKSASAKYKYKEPAVDDSQQSWVVQSEFPTQYSSLNSITGFRMRGRKTGRANSLDHSFPVKPGSVDSKGTKMKMKFFPWDKGGEPKSGGGMAKFTLGMFAASLVTDKKTGTNRLKIMYSYKKANEAGMMMETNLFNDLKTQMAVSNKYSNSAPLECAFDISGAITEAHDGATQAKYKATTKAASARLTK